MKKVLAIVLALALILCAACAAPATTDAKSEAAPAKTETTEKTEAAPADANKPDPIKIAVFIALSGSDAASAVFQIQALDLAVAQINEKGGVSGMDGAELELVYFDTMSDSNQMKTIVENALSDDSIAFALFPVASSYTFASIAAITKSGVPSLVTARSDSVFQQGCDYVYTIGQLSSKGASLTFDYCDWLAKTYNLDTTKVGIVSVDNEYGKTNAETYQQKVEGMDGYEVGYYSLYPSSTSDMSSIVTALKAKDIQILFYTGLDQDSKLLFNTMAMMNYNPVVIGGGSGLLYPTYAEALGDDVCGLVSSSMGNSRTATAMADPDYKALVEECYKQYGHEGGDYLLCYDSFLKIIVQTLNETKTTDRETNNKALKSMEYETLYTTVDENGNATKKLTFAADGSCPAAILTMVQYRHTEHGNVPVCIYPESYATDELQFGTGIK